jgi:hypothetical protein
VNTNSPPTRTRAYAGTARVAGAVWRIECRIVNAPADGRGDRRLIRNANPTFRNVRVRRTA